MAAGVIAKVGARLPAGAGRFARSGPAFELLESKLLPPRGHDGTVPRAGLIDRIERSRSVPVMVLSAGPGWGKSTLLAGGIVLAALGLGMAGYHWVAGLTWVDAVLDASMILTGMGPVHQMDTTAAKLFAAGYALFSGVVFLTAMSIVLAPVFHRALHTFHLDEDSDD